MAKRIVLYLLYLIIIVALFVAILFAFQSTTKTKVPKGQMHHRQDTTAQPNRSTNGSQAVSSSQTAGQASRHSQPTYTGPTPTSSTQMTPSDGGTTAAPRTTTAHSGNLSNTGPGSDIAIFSLAAVVGGIGWSWKQRRQLH